MSSTPYRSIHLGDLTPVVEHGADGSLRLRAREPLESYPVRFTDRLEDWAQAAPERTLFAWRRGDEWERLTYAGALARIQPLAQALLDRGLSPERPLVVLSGNSAEHLLLALAAQHVGIPYVPISPAYSLLSKDFVTLGRALAHVTPGLVFVDDRARFARAVETTISKGTEILTAANFESLLSTSVSGDVSRAHEAVTGDTIAKILFTSGSTGTPKGVINTHKMICSNQQMILQAFRFLGDAPPVLVDWLPWHHTFGGNHNIGIVVYNGGSMYLDAGRPMRGQFAETARNLKDVPPTVFMNVPKAFDELLHVLADDRAFAESFFQKVQFLFYAAASMSQRVAEEIQRLAVETCGERLPLITGLGATETAPMAICRPWDDPRTAAIGLPVPGLDVKLVPLGDRYEVRVSGPNVTPGYWREEALTRAAFDEEGFYRMGDAVRLSTPGDPAPGLLFDGRIAEDFKMSSGTWVHVGPLRSRVVVHFAPYVKDVVVTGHNRNELGMLVVPDVDACRALCSDLPPDAAAEPVLAHHEVRETFRALLTSFAAAASGSATRILRAILLDEPPSLDAQETTDKGAINQRAILTRRASLVEAMYEDMPPRSVIIAASLDPHPAAPATQRSRA